MILTCDCIKKSNVNIAWFFIQINYMSTTFLQQIINGRLLLVVIIGVKK